MLSLTSKCRLAVQKISSKSLHPTLCLCLRYSQIADNEQYETKFAYLASRRILEVKGRDASNFLQGIISNDVELLPQMKCIYSMILNQHGRVMHDVMLYHHQSEDESSILLECETESVESLIKMLKLYKLRKKVSIAVQEQIAVMHALCTAPQSESALPFTNILVSAADPRVPMLGHRIIVENTKDVDLQNSYDANRYHHKRIYTGVPEGVVDLPSGNCLPLECNLDYMNGVSFHKGCYIGQELTARTKFTGVIRKRLVPLNIKGEGPIDSGTSIYTLKGRSAGKFRSMHPDGDIGLGVVRLNHVGETLVTKNGSHEFNCHIPMWWPSEDGTEFSDGVCGPIVEENA